MNVTSIVCSCFVLFQSYAQFMQNRCIYGVTTAYMESSCIEPCKLGRRSRVWPQSWFMSLAWSPLRGTIRASNGFNLLKNHNSAFSNGSRKKANSHSYSSTCPTEFGQNFFPGDRIDSRQDIENRKNACHDKPRVGFREETTWANSSAYSSAMYHKLIAMQLCYLRPKPKTKADGSSGRNVFKGCTTLLSDLIIERNRSGLKVSGSGKYCSSWVIALFFV